ncbi:MAG: MFS transporter, partial [Pseudomonadota bacterium]|nr:MFS transporter [Pseudomonadota bacterium]
VVADRIDVRWGSICSYATAGILSGIFAAISILGGLTPVLLGLFSLLTGIVSSTNHPMRMSLTPRLAPAQDLPSVVAVTALNFNLSRLIGPVIGGFLIQSVGAPYAFAITAATYAAPVTAIFFMRPRDRSTPTSAAGSGYLDELLDGWRYALARRHVRAAIIFAGIGALAGRSVLETLPILANGVFDQGPSGLGYMTAAAGAGAAGASIFLAISKPQQAGSFGRHVLAMPVLVPLLVSALTTVSRFEMAVAVVALIGATVTLLAISLQSIVQLAIEDHYRGRVMGLWTTISIGSGAAGAILMGLLIDLLGVAAAQMTIGMALAGLSCLILIRFRRRRISE